MLNHRDDQEAFYAYVDRLQAEATWLDMPPLQTPEDLDKYPEFLKRVQGESGPHNSSSAM